MSRSAGPLSRLADRLEPVGAWDAEFADLTAREPAAGRARLGACLPSPFVSLWSAPADVRSAWQRGEAGPLVGYLDSPRSLRMSPVHVGGPAPARGSQRPGTLAAALASQAWLAEHQALRRHQVDALAGVGSVGARLAPDGLPVPGRVSVVLAFDGSTPAVPDSIRTTLTATPGTAVEVLVVDIGAPLEAALDVAAMGSRAPGLHYDLARPPTSLGAALQTGLQAATGEYVVLVGAHIRLEPGWLAPLVDALREPGVVAASPVVLQHRYGIAAAGLGADVDGLPIVPLLADHAVDDRRHIRGVWPAAVGGGVVAVRADHARDAGGLDDELTGALLEADLALRLAEGRHGAFRVVADSLVRRSVAAAPEPSVEQVQRFAARWSGRRRAPAGPTSRSLLDDAARRRPSGSRRWGIRIASTPGPAGDLWGDTAFAESLGTALRRIGQEVVLRRRDHHEAPGAESDEVSLALRGSVPVRPRPGRINVLWVISHPDEVSAEELLDHDLVYAASGPWAAALSRRTGRTVRPLLQAVDVTRLPSLGTPAGPGQTAVFVGTAVDRARPIVTMALEAGIPVAVHGPGWRGKLPPGVHRSERVDNTELTTLYRRHGLVLADHWPDMARNGFMSNRLFDAVASGARVLCDEIAGGLDLFSGAVQPVTSVADLRAVWNGSRPFPAAPELDRIAGGVRSAHSFDARARVLLDDVEEWSARAR